MIQDIANVSAPPLSFRLSILAGEGVGLAAGKSRIKIVVGRRGRSEFKFGLCIEGKLCAISHSAPRA